MAVAHSAASESTTTTTPSTSVASFTWTHTQTGTPRGVLVFVYCLNSATATATSVTYGGVTVPAVTGGSTSDAAGEPGRIDTYFLGTGLPAGNQSIVINRTNNTVQMYATAATVTALYNTEVNTTGIVLLTADQVLVEQTVSDGWPGSFSVRYAGTYSGLQTPPTAGANSTLLNSIDAGNFGAAMVRETTAGQGPRSVGLAGGVDDVAAVHLAIREVRPRRVIVYR
jgi:hypothetical protein